MKTILICVIIMIGLSCNDNVTEPKSEDNIKGYSRTIECDTLIIGNGYPYMINVDYTGITFTELSTGLAAKISNYGGELIISKNYPVAKSVNVWQLLNRVDSLEQKLIELQNKIN